MSILLNPYSEREAWLDALRHELPDTIIQLWPEIHDPEAVEFAVFWLHDTDDLRRYPNLRFILAVTAGVEQFSSGAYPDVPIVRMADPAMAEEMAAFVVHWVIHFQRKLDTYLSQQARKIWKPVRSVPAADYPVGILGFGTIGRRIGEALSALGFAVNAWSRSAKPESGIRHYRGRHGLLEMVASSRAVINVLPHTSETRGVIDAEVFAQFAPDSIYISIGRGVTTHEPDLLAALDEGHPSAAVLDVTATEPLPEDSPLWNHPRVRVTPHTSGFTRAKTAAPILAANIRRIRRGDPPFPLYDPQQGY